jgi:hypothetical protein
MTLERKDQRTHAEVGQQLMRSWWKTLPGLPTIQITTQRATPWPWLDAPLVQKDIGQNIISLSVTLEYQVLNHAEDVCDDIVALCDIDPLGLEGIVVSMLTVKRSSSQYFAVLIHDIKGRLINFDASNWKYPPLSLKQISSC